MGLLGEEQERKEQTQVNERAWGMCGGQDAGIELWWDDGELALLKQKGTVRKSGQPGQARWSHIMALHQRPDKRF